MEEYRIVRHARYEGARGEYELQWRVDCGDWQHVAYATYAELAERALRSAIVTPR